jgi:putative mRNA 3-end processing factor
VTIETKGYGESITIGDVAVSFHPAGHILGSAQVRLEHHGEVWVVSGDYKTATDPTCDHFVPVRCHGFVTEATFGLPIYRWPPADKVFAEINDWWRRNANEARASVLFGYAPGKAQRLVAGVDPSIGPIFTHGAVEHMMQAYRASGVSLPHTQYVMNESSKAFAGGLILAPPGANGSSWVRRFGDFSSGLASGWMQVRGARRRRAVDRGFVLSDHADWSGLLDAIRATGAETVWVTHGYSSPLVRWLGEQGLNSRGLATRFEGEPLDSVQEEPLD